MTGNVIETVMGAGRAGRRRAVSVLRLFHEPGAGGAGLRADRAIPTASPASATAATCASRGVKVGSIVSETLDPKTFLATVRMSIDPAYQLPDDTVAEIVSGRAARRPISWRSCPAARNR